MSDIPEDDLIAYAITETFGERCPDHEETCPCCRAWGQYDAIEARIAAAEQRGVERAAPNHSPLEWKDWCDGWQACTPFGNYTVERRDDIGWVWRYYFDEYYDEDEFTGDGPDECKASAQADWDGRISGILAAAIRRGGG